jgi:hypothetical protein
MRIVIEIDDVELVPKAEQPKGAAEVVPEVPYGATQTAALTAPASLLKAAAALGAENAGPAPSDLSHLTMTEVPFSMVYGFAGLPDTGAIDAGSAPVGANESASETIKKSKDQ